jgi:hypothetical protein
MLGEEPPEVRGELGHGRKIALHPVSTTTLPQAKSPAEAAPKPIGDFGVVRKLLPYLWEYRGRVLLALAFLIVAKLANIGVPLLMKGMWTALPALCP